MKKQKSYSYGRPRFSLNEKTGEIKYNGIVFARTTFASIGAFVRPAREMIRLANDSDVREFNAGKNPEYI